MSSAKPRLALAGWSAPLTAALRRLEHGRLAVIVDDQPERGAATAAAAGAEAEVVRPEELPARRSEIDALVVAGAVSREWLGEAFPWDLPVWGAPGCWKAPAEGAPADPPPHWMPAGSLRFEPAVAAIRQRLDQGKLGRPGLLRAHRWRAESGSESGADAGAESSAESLWESLWREVDCACWLFGDAPDCVQASSRVVSSAERAGSSRREPDAGKPAPGESDPGESDPGGSDLSADYWQLHLGFPGGGMALIDSGCSLPPGGGYWSLSLIGSQGAAYADDHHNSQLVFRGGRPVAALGGSEAWSAARELNAFADAVGGHRAAPLGAGDWRLARRILEAARSSSVSGEPRMIV